MVVVSNLECSVCDISHDYNIAYSPQKTESPKSSVGSCPSPRSRMNNVTETNDDEAKWPDTAVVQFLSILNERVKKTADGNLSFKPSEWDEIDREMIKATGLCYGPVKLKGKMNRLKMLYNQFSELIAHTGVTYNPSTNIVHACEDTWNKFYAKNPSKFKAFKRNGCKHYELMAEVFARSVATGGLAKSSSQRPPNSDEERDDEDEFLHSAKPSSFFTEGGTSSKGKRSLDDLLNVGGSTMKSGNKKLREQFGNTLDTISMSISSKQIRRKAREDASMMSMAAMGNPYSMKACMEILNIMGDIPFKVVNACIQQWANPDIREAFIELR